MTRRTKSAKAGNAARAERAQQKVPVWEWTGAIAATDVPSLTKLVCLNIARYLSSAGKGWRVSIKQMMAIQG